MSAPTTPTFAECRTAARAVRRAERGRAAIGVIRPRDVWLFRARPPLAVLLYLAASEGRLIWESTEAFAVIEPPLTQSREWTAGPRANRFLGRLDRWWPPLCFLVPPGLALILALALIPILPYAFARPWGIVVVSCLVLFAAVLLVSQLAAWMPIAVVSFLRRYSAIPEGLDLQAEERRRNNHWSMTLCHAADPGQVGVLLRRAVEQSVTLASTALPPDPAFGTPLLVCIARAATSVDTRERLITVAEGLGATSEAGCYLVSGSGPVVEPNVEAIRPPGNLWQLLLLMACIVLTQPIYIASAEREDCSSGDCPDRPATYLRALQWLLGKIVFWTEPTMHPVNWEVQWTGILAPLYGPALLTVIVGSVWRHHRYQREREKMLYQRVQHSGRRSRVLLLVVNEIERDAVIASVTAATGIPEPQLDLLDMHAVFRLGSIGATEIRLAQSEQGAVNPGSMPLTAKSLLDDLAPDMVVLTGVCYGLRSRRYDGGEQELGDLVVATQLRAADHVKVTTTGDGERHEIDRGVRPESSVRLLNRLRAATYGWPGPRVHFGPVISLSTLLNNEQERERLRRAHEDAIGGEMELAGLYAAAARTKSDWIMVKGISDWGMGKTDDCQQAAAQAAARFVVRFLQQGREDVSTPAE
ncbi:5'-methylthioadenosine/S-adenosylhomocysteine nucleosidase family protein [Micromonospora echinofusca]|uniref:Nucleoside phosphorylase domain-containing protein n=1 Tax=Micromonospora echinofusca TaxID=47858 RepID=A0ABS3W0B5_MICEH|nr:hypothetical protein [Micromonospora echinofusca]MBO4210227.1 hypothetical protein [Micromonospora echinofusca]